MPRSILRLTPILLILVASCGEEATQDFYVEPEIPEDPVALTNRAAESVADREELPDASVISPLAGSGVQGSFTITPSAAGLEIRIEVEGLPEAAEFAAHVHRGVCAEGGPVAALLTSVIGGEDGSGSSVSTVPADQLPPTDPLFVQIHGVSGAPIACGDIVES